MRIQDIDHIDITVNDIEQAMRFYHEVLDLPIILEDKTRIIFQLGKQKLYCRLPNDDGLAANNPTVGSTAFSILAKDSLQTIEDHLANYFIEIVKGPIKTSLKNKKIISLFIKDPFGNLIEIKEYQK